MGKLDEISNVLTEHVRDAQLGWRDGNIVVTAGDDEGTYNIGYRNGREDDIVRQAENVPEKDIIRTAERITVQEYLKWMEGRGDNKAETGIPEFELVNGHMTIWGKNLWVGSVSIDGNGVERVEPWVTNSHTLYVMMDKNNYVMVHTGKGRRMELFSDRTKDTKKLRFVLNGETIDLNHDMLVKHFKVAPVKAE